MKIVRLLNHNIVILLLLILPLITSAQDDSRCETIGQPELQNITKASYPRNSITIPVVFHIVYNDERENLSKSIILNQLDVINRDFSGQNVDLELVPAEFKKYVGNPGFEFCLATKDPFGSDTEGIVRINTDIKNIANKGVVDGQRQIKNKSQGGSSPWLTKQYLNIWIGARNDGIIGDATFPNQTEVSEPQGIVIRYDAIGEIESLNPKYNKGRTLTHELAHYFNVQHLWGSETGCNNDDDEIADTPEQGEIYTGCDREVAISCRSRDMDTNFLNFRDDECLNFFTKGQAEKMVDALFRFRFGLIQSQICSDIVALPPDPLSVANILTNIDASYISLRTLSEKSYRLHLYDMSGRQIWNIANNENDFYKINHFDMPSGIYILHLELGESRFARKVFIP